MAEKYLPVCGCCARCFACSLALNNIGTNYVAVFWTGVLVQHATFVREGDVDVMCPYVGDSRVRKLEKGSIYSWQDMSIDGTFTV